MRYVTGKARPDRSARVIAIRSQLARTLPGRTSAPSGTFTLGCDIDVRRCSEFSPTGKILHP